MKMKRSEIRELAFKFIYSIEIQKIEDLEEQINIYLEGNEIEDEQAIEYIRDCVCGIEENKDYINETIKNALTSEWKIERISKINLSLLKLAVYEIKFKDIPFKAEINEVVELAKVYGEETSSKFINGALAQIVKEMQLQEGI